MGGKLQQRDMPGVLAQRRAGGQQLFEVVIPAEPPDHDTGRTLAIDQWLGQGAHLGAQAGAVDGLLETVRRVDLLLREGAASAQAECEQGNAKRLAEWVKSGHGLWALYRTRRSAATQSAAAIPR